MSRIAELFATRRAQGKKTLIVYLTADYPNPAACRALAAELAAAGVDLFEIGLPFSDPMADGPVIQETSAAALAAGVTTDSVLRLVDDLRGQLAQPLAVMTYYNPVLQAGPGSFVDRFAAAGGDALLVPDLPMEECEELDDLCQLQKVDLIRFLAPTTTPERMTQICDGATGFLYCVAHAGVTGNSQTVKNEAPELVAAARKMTATPLAIGFGIDGPAAAATAAAQADAVIIGTAVLAKLKAEGVGGAGRFVREIRAAMDAERLL